MAKELHVVMVPYAAFGHLLAFFHLSVALAKAGIRVSFISTPRNIQRLPKPPSNLSSLINFVGFPFPVVAGSSLPEGAESTIDVSFEKENDIKAAYDLLSQPFKQFVINESPNWMIIDFFPHWAIDIADELAVPVVCFSVFSASTKVFVGPPDCLNGDGLKNVRPSPESLLTPPPWVSFPSTVAARCSEAYGFYNFFFNCEPSERVGKIIRGCKAVAIRSCMEIEGEYLEVLEKIYRKSVIPVGLLPPELPERSDHGEEWGKTFEWLDEKETKSVVFVGFGSACKLSKDELHEIAYGLELSNLPFLWSLINHESEPEFTGYVEILPPSFVKNTAGRGLVCMGWAPQEEILAHPAIGGSLFHAGWGSIIENLKYGHRLIVLPRVFDQGLNARFLVDKGLAVQVKENEEGSFSRDDIAECLKQAMVSEEGKQMGVKAAEAAAVVSNPRLHQDHYLGRFVQYLKDSICA